MPKDAKDVLLDLDGVFEKPPRRRSGSTVHLGHRNGGDAEAEAAKLGKKYPRHPHGQGSCLCRGRHLPLVRRRRQGHPTTSMRNVLLKKMGKPAYIGDVEGWRAEAHPEPHGHEHQRQSAPASSSSFANIPKEQFIEQISPIPGLPSSSRTPLPAPSDEDFEHPVFTVTWPRDVRPASRCANPFGQRVRP